MKVKKSIISVIGLIAAFITIFTFLTDVPSFKQLNNKLKNKSKIQFRSTYKILSIEDGITIIKKYDFFHPALNPNGHGINNRFESQIINGDKVVIDSTTNLMWQQGGSLEEMEFDEAEKWIYELKIKGFASYHDWRLPTFEEAMSLMESAKRSNDLYIDPIFDTTQFNIWTGDVVQGKHMDGSSVWNVYFPNIYLDNDWLYGHLAFSTFCYIRAVRSL